MEYVALFFDNENSKMHLVVAFCDTNWVQCSDDPCSSFEFTVFLGSSLLAWHFKEQSMASSLVLQLRWNITLLLMLLLRYNGFISFYYTWGICRSLYLFVLWSYFYHLPWMNPILQGTCQNLLSLCSWDGSKRPSSRVPHINSVSSGIHFSVRGSSCRSFINSRPIYVVPLV